MNQNYITLIPIDKFKDTQLSIRFLGPNREPYITHRALLAYLMTDRSEPYPTKQAVSLKTDELFALSFDVKVGAYGNYHVLEYRFTTLSERFAQEAHLTQAIDFALACIQTPLITPQTLVEAKTNLKAALTRIEDKPNQSALISALRLGGEGEPLAQFSQGSLALIDSVTLDDLKASHRKMLSEDPVFVIGIGEFSEAHATYLKKVFTFKPISVPAAYRVRVKPLKTQETQKAVKQTALVNLYATQRCNADPDYTALRVMTYLLGQLPNSLLFTEIREKRNLCYSIYSSLIHFDGALTISTGISADQKDEVNALIETQIERLKTSDYPPELLQSAKALLISNYQGLSDDVPAWMNVAFSLWLNGQPSDLTPLLDEIANINSHDIAIAASRLVLISQAIVKGEA